MRRHRSANEELFGVILRHWRSLPSEQEKARFFLSVLHDERFADLLPFMVDATLTQLGQKDAHPAGGRRSKLSQAREKKVGEAFWEAADAWDRMHPGASGLGDARKAWRFAVGQVVRRTGADPKTVKRRFPDPVEKARARVRAHVQALREGTPRK